ncbi:MAG TPA: hypothetical protein VFY06_12920 [Verrucomicrobiae bacterium]|nr:hypothetical protein [Verrucomicrobiae bacterium]
MSELMEKLLAEKAAARKRLVTLPFEEKLTLLEKMRDRGLLIKKSTPKRQPGNALPAELSATGGRRGR